MLPLPHLTEGYKVGDVGVIGRELEISMQKMISLISSWYICGNISRAGNLAEA